MAIAVLSCGGASARVITTVAGDGTIGFAGDGSGARQAAFSQPRGVGMDASGGLLIADTFNHRIRRVDGATFVVATVAGNGTQAFGGDGGPAGSASLSTP